MKKNLYFLFSMFFLAILACQKQDAYLDKVDPADGRTGPIINLNGADTVILTLGDSYTDAGATAIDADGNNATVHSRTNLNLSLAGIYWVQYFATDQYGVQTVKKRIIIIKITASVIMGNWNVDHNCKTSLLVNLLKDPADLTLGFGNTFVLNHDGREVTGSIDGDRNITIYPSIINIGFVPVVQSYQFTGSGTVSADGNEMVIAYQWEGLSGLAANGDCIATYSRN